MIGIATIDWFGRWGTSVFSGNTAIFETLHVFSMVLRSACGLDIILELIFIIFFHFVNFVIFWPQILWKCIDSGSLVSATPYTVSFVSLCNFAQLFSMVWRCSCGLGLIPQLILSLFHFVNFVIFKFFADATSTSPKFDLYFSFNS